MKISNIKRHSCWVGIVLSAHKTVLSVLLMALVFVGQVIPAQAHHQNSGSSIWIEVCADGGTYMAELEGDDQNSDCAHCVNCIVSNVAWQFDQPVFLAPVSFARTAHFFYSRKAIYVPDGPEKSWASRRGPPKLYSKTKIEIMLLSPQTGRDITFSSQGVTQWV